MTKRFLSAVLMGVLGLLSVSASAFTPDMKAIEDKTLSERYPEGTPMSREAADQLLSDVKSARAK